MSELNQKRAKIYGILDPDTNSVVYIGKANNVNARWKSHLRDSKRKKSRLYNWLNQQLAENKTIRVVELASSILDDWQTLEKDVIAQYRADGDLLNMSNGGNQPYVNVESCRKNAIKINERRKNDPLFRRIWEMKRSMASYLKHAKKDSEHYRQLTAKLRYAANKRPDLFGCWSAI
jgi:hypothetical protein